jgi:tetratricopeptide (TPR) repeat protein
MKPLPHPDNQHLEAAEGWLELGNYLEANEELEKITPQLRAHPYVLEMRYKIYDAAGRWEMALEVARGLMRILPDNQWGYFYTAYALHELKRTQEAYDVVKAVIHKFPDHQMMHFNLACYACRLGKRKEALSLLEKAIDMVGGIDIRQQALDDADLEELWPTISEI